MKSCYGVKLNNFRSGCLRKCDLFTVSFHFCLHLPLSFLLVLVVYRSEFVFLKRLLLWSAPAQKKSRHSKQRFRLCIVVNIDFLSLRDSGIVNSNANFFL